MNPIRKIINDPVYGFITIDHSLLFRVISHPYYQRLRRIHQMAFADLVYPGATHSRLLHSLGSYHLMCSALQEIKSKGTHISEEEELAAKITILLHDIGHGPFSHALENILINVPHEEMSLSIMEELNVQFGNRLSTSLEIFRNRYPKKFLYQLISGQLDVDRMDYLTRDSFFTGVSEGVIGYDRILKMLTVHNGDLMVESKAIYSIEKFLVARRLMYWQVYLHKTVLSAEKMLVGIMKRAKELKLEGDDLKSGNEVLDFFLSQIEHAGKPELQPDKFCQLDDNDISSAIKAWTYHPDKVLSTLCRMLNERNLLKVKFFSEPVEEQYFSDLTNYACDKLKISKKEANYFVFTGEAVNTTYNPSDERIQILFKDGIIKDISGVDNALIHQTLASPVKKFYICFLG